MLILSMCLRWVAQFRPHGEIGAIMMAPVQKTDILGQWQGLEECHTVQFLLPDGRLLTKADCDVALSEFCQDKQ